MGTDARYPNGMCMYESNACRTRVYEKPHVMLVRVRPSFYLFLPNNAGCQDVSKNLSVLCSAPQDSVRHSCKTQG